MQTPLSRRAVLLVTAGAIIMALVILFVGVLPAEYHRDPTGLGSLTGIARLWAPEERVVMATSSTVSNVPTARSYSMPFRSDLIDIPLRASGDDARGEELEYKVHLEKGDSYVYS